MKIPERTRRFIMDAIEEDVGSGDITSSILVPEGAQSTALFIAKGSFILAGIPFAEAVFGCIDQEVRFESHANDGARVKPSNIVAEVSGSTRSLLMGERVSLNILQRLSGIATLTDRFVSRVKGFKAKILDTRKTTPGMRYMEKYAVRVGGGGNHRFGLYDGILIKDNHIEAAGGIREAVKRAKERGGHLLRVEVEAENLKDFKDALKAGADVIMLDNMSLKDIKEAVRVAGGAAKIEVSGGVSLENVRDIAEAGADYISVGALTHSAPAVDISMKIMRRN